MSLYREKLDRNCYLIEESDIDNETEWIKKDDVKSIIDNIESDVNEIERDLEKYAVFDALNNILTKVRKLSSNLY